jgi:hypothetical protein
MNYDDFTEIPPSDFEIRRLFQSDDELGVVLKGHLYVEPEGEPKLPPPDPEPRQPPPPVPQPDEPAAPDVINPWPEPLQAYWGVSLGCFK